MVELNGSIRLIALQFGTNNPDVIPMEVIETARRTVPPRRTGYFRGSEVIRTTEMCSPSGLLEGLSHENYVLVDLLDRTKSVQRGPGNSQLRHSVRFVFAPARHAYAPDKFGHVEKWLDALCGDSLWRVQAFLNPFYSGGEEVPGLKVVTIKLDGRVPLYFPYGVRNMARKKVNGRREGVPEPVVARHRLAIVDGTLALV